MVHPDASARISINQHIGGARLLADCLDGQEEVILGPTDHKFCAMSLRALADLTETNLA